MLKKSFSLRVHKPSTEMMRGSWSLRHPPEARHYEKLRAYQRSVQRLAAQSALTHVLAESATLSDAAPKVLETVCKLLDWEMGAIWSVPQNSDVLKCVEVWHLPTVQVTEFVRVTRESRFPRGVGLPGRVWASGKPAWIPDVTQDTNFPRAPFAARVGLHGAFGFPVLLAGEVLGVIEFFSREIRQPDGDILEMFARMGSQIGQFDARTRAQAALARSEQDLSDFFENAAVGLYWVGPDGYVLRTNRAELQLLGYSREEYVGHHISEFHADEDTIQDILQALSRGETLHNREARLRCKDGSIRRVLIDSNVLWSEGKFVHARCFTRDITELKRAEQRQHFLLEASTVLASSLDYETRLASLAHLTVPALADWCVVDLIDDGGQSRRVAQAHIDPVKEKLLSAVLQERSPDPDVTHPLMKLFRSGEPVFYPEISITLLADLTSDTERKRECLYQLRELGTRSGIGMPLQTRDRTLGSITLVYGESGRRYEEPDLALVADLARRAALAIDNAWLYRQAQEASRIKDEFLATVSHEIRTPLNAMLGWVRMLRTRSVDPATASHALEIIERNGKAQAQIIDDILDVSRIVNGKLQLTIRPVALVPVIEAAIEAVRPAAEAKAIRLAIFLDPDTAPVSGDPDRLQQVVWNLLSNAIKFTSERGEVQVRLARASSSARITVSDTGKGIRAEFLPYVFDRFRQGDGSTARRYGGLGLGLAIVRHLVELHGGSVQAESAGEGQGAKFTIEIPLASYIESDVHHSVGLRPGVSLPRCMPSLDHLRILVVDDEADSRDLAIKILELCGGRVTGAASATEALEALRRSDWDVLVSDIRMPDMDGCELIHRIMSQGLNRARRLKTVALTAYANQEDLTRAIDAGYHKHVAKPFEPILLAAVIAELARKET